MQRRHAVPLAVLLIGLCLMAYCVIRAGHPESGTLRIGYAVEPPYAFVTADGTVSGEGPEVAKCIAARLGVSDIQWRLSEFGSLLAELEQGRIDIIAAGMFITADRARRVAFSRPTFHVCPGLLVTAGNPLDLHSHADIVARAGVRAAVLDGAVEEQLLRAMGLPDERLLRVPDAQTGRAAVESGVAQCLALSRPSLQWMAREAGLGRTELARPFSPRMPPAFARLGYGALVFRRDDVRLQAWNRELQSFVGSAEHLALVSRFGFSRDDMPANMTAHEVLAP